LREDNSNCIAYFLKDAGTHRQGHGAVRATAYP
jgi:hypothetical protein